MTPVALLHGMASTFDHNWRGPGWVDLLGEGGREVLPLHLPGHGPAPADPVAIGDPPAFVAAQLAEVSGGRLVDAVGFSAGAQALLGVAARGTTALRRLALLGIGSFVLQPDTGGAARLADLLDGPDDTVDVMVRVLRRMALAAGNDPGAVAAYLRRPRPPLRPEDLARVRCPVLVVLGDRDTAAPADRLVAGLPDARLVTLRGTDHFATTSDPRAMDAVLDFLAG